MSLLVRLYQQYIGDIYANDELHSQVQLDFQEMVTHNITLDHWDHLQMMLPQSHFLVEINICGFFIYLK
jgi:hypothetical protein